MTTEQNARQYVKDMMSQGKMSAAEANVEIIRMVGVRVVSGKIPAQVRRDLNSAVKAGKLGRLPKKGLAPEVYFHPNSRARALAEQRREVDEAIEAIKRVCI